MPRFCLSLLTLGVLALAPGAAWGQAPKIDAAAVDQIVTDALKAWQAPGAAVVIVQDGQVVYLKGFGVKEAGGSAAVTPDTLFAIASTSKAFTCTALAMLVMDGKLQWDDPVRKHVEFFRLADPLADRAVTVRDLVTHRTGLSRHDLLWLGTGWNQEEIIRRIGFVPLTQPFRSAYQYQNIMYATAGYAAGKAAGSSWEELTRQRIFAPLGMKGANFSTRDAEKAADHATPHSKNGLKAATTRWRNVDHIGPAGAINAGVRDLGQWLRFQLGDGTFEGQRLLTPALLRETHTPQMVIPFDGSTGVASFTRAMNPETNMMSYGLGWVIQDYRGQLMVSHGGSLDGFRAQAALLPRQQVGMAILSNLGRTSLPEAVRNGIADLVLGSPRRDWNAHYLAQSEKAQAADRERDRLFDARRQKDTKPSREPAAYIGRYDDPAYGPLTLTLDGSTLVARWNGFTMRLEHWHFDTFMPKGDALFRDKPLTFALAADGTVERVRFLDQEFTKAKSAP